MPDISMCKNIFCPLNKTCYRYRAIPNEYRQTYGVFSPDEEGKCNYYLPIELGDRLNKEDNG